jgi:hypothetical protein
VASSPDGVALILEFTVNRNRLTGNVIQFTAGESSPLENATVDGAKFEFVVYKKIASIKVGTTYRGELTEDDTITIERLSPNGKPTDINADGTPKKLIFHRLRESELPQRPQSGPRPLFQLVSPE